MRYSINEIFYSLQGEGHHTGRASVFVRFSGCNLKCPFCDTDYHAHSEMTAEEIVAEVNRFPADWIVLTGGEPSLQVDAELIAKLKEETGKGVAIETNGTHPLPAGIDWITLSPKEGGEVRLEHADEIKVVDLGQDLEPYFSLPCRSERTLMYLQPCCVQDPDEFRENRCRTIRRVLEDPRWKLSVQTHKYLEIP